MYGLLGKKLGHSRSPHIHRLLGDYPYILFEKEEEQLDEFFAKKEFRGINVTVPYKQTVIRYCNALSDQARRIGAVNTIVQNDKGELIGHNTDYVGFLAMVQRSGITVKGKKCLVLGSGGASKTVCAVLEDLQALETVVISRTGENNYKNIYLHSDASLIVNTTPVGMYPNVDQIPVDPGDFPALQGVLDVIYNPRPTKLLALAMKRGVIGVDGLYMLVCQAIAAAELFLGKTIGYDEAENICKEIERTL